MEVCLPSLLVETCLNLLGVDLGPLPEILAVKEKKSDNYNQKQLQPKIQQSSLFLTTTINLTNEFLAKERFH